MATINLLPWRDAYREQKRNEFIQVLVVVSVIAAGVAYLWLSSAEAALGSQNDRNRILQGEITLLEKQVDEIKELKKRRDELTRRMKVIQDLQGTRSVIVHYFDDLVRAIPDGLYLTSLKREGEVVSLEGIAESNNRISSFMRKLDGSDWYTSPNLTAVSGKPGKEGEQSVAFKMTVATSMPEQQKKEEG